MSGELQKGSTLRGAFFFCGKDSTEQPECIADAERPALPRRIERGGALFEVVFDSGL